MYTVRLKPKDKVTKKDWEKFKKENPDLKVRLSKKGGEQYILIYVEDKSNSNER